MATTMEQLGAKRKRLLAELAAVEEALVPLMREARAGGATWAAIMMESGYGSIEGVKRIVVPGRRDAANEAARVARSSGWNFKPPTMGIGKGGGCVKIRLDHAAPPYGPYCQLEAAHAGECEYPPYPINHPHDAKGRCITDGSVAA